MRLLLYTRSLVLRAGYLEPGVKYLPEIRYCSVEPQCLGRRGCLTGASSDTCTPPPSPAQSPHSPNLGRQDKFMPVPRLNNRKRLVGAEEMQHWALSQDMSSLSLLLSWLVLTLKATFHFPVTQGLGMSREVALCSVLSALATSQACGTLSSGVWTGFHQVPPLPRGYPAPAQYS